MEYMLMVYVHEGGWFQLTPEQQAHGMAAYRAYVESLQKAGVLRTSSQLGASATAKTIRTTGGKTQVLDGPFADSKEQLGGFFLIDVPDLETALSWASRCPAVNHGVVEVRTLNR
jgi:hypothetical protein